MFPHVLV